MLIGHKQDRARLPGSLATPTTVAATPKQDCAGDNKLRDPETSEGNFL